MGLVLVKKKVAVEPVPDVSEFADQIDLFGRLSEEAEPVLAEIKKLQDKLKPLADAKKSLQASVDSILAEDDAEKLIELGEEFRVEIGKKGTSREIKDIVAVKKLMGNELFMKVATVTLKDLDAYLTLPQRETVIETKRTSRGFKLARRA